MKFFVNLIIFFFLITSCSFNKVIKKHGVRNLGEKQAKLITQKANKNDIQLILGPPSTKSTFDNDLYFYIERKITTKSLIKLGKQKYLENNVLIVEIDDRGIAKKKEFYQFWNTDTEIYQK